MNLRLLFISLCLCILAACVTKPPYIIGDIVPAGSRVEYFAQLDDGSWKSTLKMSRIPRDMHIKEAEKWALSAAQQRLGGKWKDYSFRVTPPEGKPVVMWRRSGPYN